MIMRAEGIFRRRTNSGYAARSAAADEPQLQMKLSVGSVNDPMEDEADRMADKVMRMPEEPVIRRKCQDCGEEESVMRRPLSDAITPFVRAMGEEGGVVSEPVAEGIHASRGRGDPMPADTRSFMENRFGEDFSKVRLHTGEEAERMSGDLNAQAFTVGNDIYFNSGRYSPVSAEGRQLLAHELTHTLQQKNNTQVNRKIKVDPGLELDTMGFTVSKTGDTYSAPRVTKSSVWNEIFSSLLNTSRVFKLKGSTDEEANESLKSHMEARKGIIDFAAKKKYTFAAGAASKVNPEYWQAPLVLKPGVDRQEALEDLNINPKEYAIACLAATTMTMVGGAKSNYVESTTPDENDWTPGDWGYIKNTKFSGKAADVGLEGENIIYVGKDRFWGHFTGKNTYRPFKDWFEEVKGWNGGAETKTHRRFPVAGLE
jgi:hypothetical protein